MATTRSFTKAGVLVRPLHRELKAVLGATLFNGVRYDDDTGNGVVTCTAELTAQNETDIDAVIAAHPNLVTTKRLKRQAIDKRTKELIAEGFTYSGKKFSLSLAAQSNMLRLEQRADAEAYPYKMPTGNGAGKYNVTDAADAHALTLACHTAIRVHVVSGIDLKVLVNQATTIPEVDAIVDNR